MTKAPELVVRSEIERSVWNTAADAFGEAWMWHRDEAIEAYATWHRTADISFALCDGSSDRPVVLMPLRHVVGRRPFARMLGHLESTGGPAFDPDLTARQRQRAERTLHSCLVALAARTGAHRIEMSLAPLAPALRGADAPRVNPLAMLGGTDASTQSWVLDLGGQTESELWRNLEQRVRKAVKRAERAGVTVRPATIDDQSRFVELHGYNTVRTGLLTKPTAYFNAIFGTFLETGMAIGFGAVAPDGRVIAVHIFGVYKGAAIYWVVASDEKARELGANDLVQWHAIKAFASMGLTHYESGEAFPGKPEGKLRRISDFKRGFGGTLAPYHRSVLITRPRIAAALDLSRAFR